MTVIDEPLLDEFRAPGPCDLCGKQCDRREPHHVVTTGSNGGRLDVRENIVGVGKSEDGNLRRRDFQMPCRCHDGAQSFDIPLRCVHACIADREGRTIEEIARFLTRLRRSPKGADVEAIRREVFKESHACKP